MIDLLIGIQDLEDPHLQVHLQEQEDVNAQVFVQVCLIPAKIPLQPAKPQNADPYAFCEAIPHFSTRERRSFEDAAQRTAMYFANAPISVRHTYLMDYVEDIVGLTVGQQHAFQFIRKCLLRDDN